MQKNSKNNYKGIYNKYIKRCFDIILSLIVSIITLPFSLIIALCIIIDDGFPVLYKAKRGGYHNKAFEIKKFRTMIKNADKIGGGTTALNDDRITKVGKFLRRCKLDEFPQFYQVFTGKMSLVGPRPELLKYTDKYKGDELKIFEVRPGITDYSSVKFASLDEVVGSDNADEMYEKHVLKKKNRLRIKYANDVSFCTDIKILFSTAIAVIKKFFGIGKKII